MSVTHAMRIAGVLAGSLALLVVRMAGAGSLQDQAVGPEPNRASCTPCHVCENPSTQNPCVRACPMYARSSTTTDPTEETTPCVPPDVVMLNDLEDLYQPVPFDHKGHAAMAEMSTGCVACHHHTPEGNEHPACRHCHRAAPVREDTAMPGLKGAYHRQCLGCHREWSHDTACNVCHVPKAQRGVLVGAEVELSPAVVARRMGPPVKGEATYVYQTQYEASPVVTFHHLDHVDSFGLRCCQCHHGDSCGRCHDNSAERVHTAHQEVEHLKHTCFTCHEEQNCAYCHDDGPRASFDHAKTAGWPLEPHHADVPCSDCHGPTTQFSVPSRTCHACHLRQPGQAGVGAATVTAGNRERKEVACLSCHEQMRERLEHAVCVHGPAADPNGCVHCHDLQQAFDPRPKSEQQSELCLTCHNRPIDCSGGRRLKDIGAVLAKGSFHHGPVRQGNCCACHDPHCSTYAHQLVAEYAPEFYASFDVKRYELCLRCHVKDQLLMASGTDHTGFRDGDLNLHWLHVNKAKGRTCRACHEIHASSRPFHIRESVPFGRDCGWALPINYQQTTDGGTCAPGCHAPKTYGRNHVAQAFTPAVDAVRRRIH